MSDMKTVLMLLKGIDARLTALEEKKHGPENTGGDGRPRIQQVPIVRATDKAPARQDTKRDGRKDRGHSRREPRRNPQPDEQQAVDAGLSQVTVDLEGRRKAEVAALDGGVHGAVASFSPPGAAEGPPSRSVEVKPLWNVGDIIPCTACKEPIYEVVRALTTASKLAELPAALEPYSETIPRLVATTPVKNIGGVWFNCPRCFKEWAVTVA